MYMFICLPDRRLVWMETVGKYEAFSIAWIFVLFCNYSIFFYIPMAVVLFVSQWVNETASPYLNGKRSSTSALFLHNNACVARTLWFLLKFKMVFFSFLLLCATYKSSPRELYTPFFSLFFFYPADLLIKAIICCCSGLFMWKLVQLSGVHTHPTQLMPHISFSPNLIKWSTLATQIALTFLFCFMFGKTLQI